MYSAVLSLIHDIIILQINHISEKLDQGKLIQSMQLLDNPHANKFKKLFKNPMAVSDGKVLIYREGYIVNCTLPTYGTKQKGQRPAWAHVLTWELGAASDSPPAEPGKGCPV